MSRNFLTHGLLMLAVLAGGIWLMWPRAENVPDVTLNLLDGRTLSSSDLRGRSVLINFWSVSCEICLREMPKLTRLQESLEERGLMVIGVAMPYDPPPAVIGIADRLAPGFAIALDVHGEVSRAFGDVEVTPTTFVIAPDGKIKYAERGPLDETRIRATLATF